jgi:hypothetical protein
MPARHFHAIAEHLKVIAGHLLLAWRTVKVIRAHLKVIGGQVQLSSR